MMNLNAYINFHVQVILVEAGDDRLFGLKKLDSNFQCVCEGTSVFVFSVFFKVSTETHKERKNKLCCNEITISFRPIFDGDLHTNRFFIDFIATRLPIESESFGEKYMRKS
jgi:hypothetical protein